MFIAQLMIRQEEWAAIVSIPIALLAGFVYGFLVTIQPARLTAYSLVIVVPISLLTAASGLFRVLNVPKNWFEVGLLVYLAFCLALGSVLLCRRSFRRIGLFLVAGPLLVCGVWIVALTSR